MIIDEEVYLKHHGVLGMHWGVRNQKQPSGIKTDHRKRNKRIAIGVGTAVGATAAILIAHNMHVKTSTIKAETKHIAEAKKLLDANKAKHMALISNINKQRFTTNAAANSDLKKLYNLNDTPIHLRDYLPVN